MATNLALVEDNPADALFLRRLLESHSPGEYATTVATTLGAAKVLLVQQAFDAIVLDLSLPDSQGLGTIGQLAAAAPNVPIVVFTGVADASIVPEAVRCGAQDYLLKGQSDAATIARVIHYAIDRKRVERELCAQRRELEAKNKQLQETQRRLEAYRDRYVNLYDFAPLGYVTLDADGYVQEINLAGAELLNTDRDALTGYPFSEYVAKEDVPAFLSLVRKCVDEHCEVTFEVRLGAKGGRLITAQLHSVPVEGSEEDVTFCKTAITDISGRKEMEETIRQSHAFLQTVIDAIPDALLVIDRNYRISLANRTARAMAGDIDPTVCLTCHQLSHHRPIPCDALNEPCPLHEVIATRVPARVTHTHYDAEGKEVFVDISASPVLNAAGEVTHIIEACRDITARKRMEIRLTRLNSLKAQLLGPSDLAEKLQLITDGVVELFAADVARIWTIDEGDLCAGGCLHAAVTEGAEVCADRSRCLHLAASSGRDTALGGDQRRVPLGCGEIGRIAAGEETKFVTNNLTHDPRVDDCGWAADLGLVSFAGYGLLAPNGTPLGVLAVFSKRKIDADEEAILEDYANTAAQVIATGRAEEALHREKVFTDIAIDTIPGVFYVLDNQGRFVRWNRFLEEITGLTGKMLSGTDALQILVADDRQRVAGKIREVFEKGFADAEARLLGKDGVREFWFTGRRMDVGPITYLVGSGIDITDRKRMEEEIRRSRDDLEIRVRERTAELARTNAQLSSAKDAAEAASRAKSTFLANMSHEMRTPLNAVIGMTELVLTKQIPAQQRELLSMVKDSGEVLLRLIDEILDLARIEAGRLALAPETFDLRESLADTMKPLALRAHQRGLHLAWRVHPNVPSLVIGDPNRLRQIITNLVGNGIKFTERGEVVLEVSLELLAGPDLVLHFTVRDTGVGIPEDKQAAIFGMFEQADSSLARSHGGAGLGLAIASQLVGLMQGRLWVESEVGRGSRFHFTIRLGLAHTAAALASRSTAPVPRPPRPSRRLRILLAEDSLVNQRLAVALLEEQGHAVTAVNNGTKLLAALESETFDLVLMDVQMPETDGLEATAKIRAQERQTGTHIPIIALTAHALQGNREQCLQAGMDGYLAKPIRAQELFEVIEDVRLAPDRRSVKIGPGGESETIGAAD